MSLASVRKALETQLNTTLSGFAVAWENVAFVPTAGTPYAAPYLLPAQPDNPEMGPLYTEQGIFQVNLFYPLNAGAKDAQAKAEAIRSAFPWRSSLTADAVTVNIIGTPEIGPGRADEDCFMVPVKVRWSAQIGG